MQISVSMKKVIWPVHRLWMIKRIVHDFFYYISTSVLYRQVHVSGSSTAADHCSTYALSDVRESRFRSTCDHAHDQTCPQCEVLTQLLESIQTGIKRDDLTLDENELVDLRYTCKQAALDIQAWKAHQLRSTRQDMARIDVLDTLSASSVIIANDWAMKFLPQKYRESQSDWFAKRGISWRISVVLWIIDGSMETQTFVHIVEHCSQDASTVIRIIEHVLRTLKEDNADVAQAFLRQDNARVTTVRSLWPPAASWSKRPAFVWLGRTLVILRAVRASMAI